LQKKQWLEKLARSLQKMMFCKLDITIVFLD